MTPSEKDRLLGSLFNDEQLHQLRATSLTAGLAAARRRRRRRAIISSAAAVMVCGIAFYLGSQVTRHRPEMSTRIAPPPRAEIVSGVKIISDEELLALFPGRNLALVGPPSAQRLVFLD